MAQVELEDAVLAVGGVEIAAIKGHVVEGVVHARHRELLYKVAVAAVFVELAKEEV